MGMVGHVLNALVGQTAGKATPRRRIERRTLVATLSDKIGRWKGKGSDFIPAGGEHPERAGARHPDGARGFWRNRPGREYLDGQRSGRLVRMEPRAGSQRKVRSLTTS